MTDQSFSQYNTIFIRHRVASSGVLISP